VGGLHVHQGGIEPLLLASILLLSILSPSFFSTAHANPGTVNVPGDYPSIQLGINHAIVGDTVMVGLGVYNERVVLNKTVHLVGAARDGTIIDGQRTGTVVTVTVDSASITGFTIRNPATFGNAVELLHVNNTSVTNCAISTDVGSGRPTGAGLDLYGSNGTLVDGNVFTHSLYGVNMSFSVRNRISNNRMLNSTLIGVEFLDSANNTIVQNRIEYGEEGLDLTGPGTIGNNVTRNALVGMSLSGVFLIDRAFGNLFVENSFLLNHIGVNIQNVTSQNTFYHNSFLRSGFRHVNHVFSGDGNLDVWDNRSLGGPKLGGNYWDDYRGTDGDNDGIGDTAYTGAAGYPTDNYPLMSPFVSVPLAVVKIIPSKVSGSVPFLVSFQADVLGTLKPFTYLWSFGDNSSNSTESIPSHTYSTAGNFTVRVVVRDGSGASDVGSVSVLASNPSVPSLILWAGLIVLGVGGGALGFVYYRRRKGRRADGVEGPNQEKRSKTNG